MSVIGEQRDNAMNPTSAVTIYRRSELESVDCLHRYHAIWRQGVDDGSDFARRGIGFHAIKHRYILRLVEKQIPQDKEEADLAFAEGIAAAQTPARLIPEIRELWDRHVEFFELPLDRFVAAEDKQPPFTCRGCGASWYADQLLPQRSTVYGLCPTCESGDMDFHPYVFTPDLVLATPQELEIIDDKTFWKSLTEVEARQSFQARFYVRHAMIRWPHFPSYRFTFAFVRFGTHVSVVFTPEDLAKLDREVAAGVAVIEEATRLNHWPATPGPSCTYCALQCPVVNHPLIASTRLVSIDEARTVGAWVLAAEQMVKTAKKALKAYSAANGAVDIQGVEWANRPVLDRSYPLDRVVEVLQTRKALEREVMSGDVVTPLHTLTISHSALKKLFQAYADLEEELAPFQTCTQSWRFSAKKPGGEETGADA